MEHNKSWASFFKLSLHDVIFEYFLIKTLQCVVTLVQDTFFVHCLNVHTTSVTLRRRRMNVQMTFCVLTEVRFSYTIILFVQIVF